jgi:hypothetical protein
MPLSIGRALQLPGLFGRPSAVEPFPCSQRDKRRKMSSEMATNGDSNMSIFERETTALEQAEAEVEGEIREFVRRDVAGLRRHTENDSTMVADNIGSLLQRVSASSVQEIDRLISDLKILRERLQDEGARVQREIVEYASLNQAAMQSTKIITESLGHWKRGP